MDALVLLIYLPGQRNVVNARLKWLRAENLTGCRESGLERVVC